MSDDYITHAHFNSVAERFGSIQSRKVNPDLQEEREKLDFDKKEFTRLIYGTQFDNHVRFTQWVKDHPEIDAGASFYDFNREELMGHMMKVAKIQFDSPSVYDEIKDAGYVKTINSVDYVQGTLSNVISMSMFAKTIGVMGTPE